MIRRVNSFENVTEAVAVDFSFFASFFLFVNVVDIVDYQVPRNFSLA